jgi:segregation and condensation protein A
LNLDDVDVWKLAEFFSGFMKQTLGDVIQNIVYDDTPVHIYMDKVLGRLNRTHSISLGELLYGSQGRTELVGFFLALLELVRLKKIKIKQPQDFDEIRITVNNN